MFNPLRLSWLILLCAFSFADITQASEVRTVLDRLIHTYGGEIQFLTEYSDFAVVEGVLVHHKENKFAGGVNTAMLQLRQITFDAQLDDSRFNP